MKHESTTQNHGDVAALSRARSFVTLLVLVYHAASNYIYFGNGDHQRWIGFDLIVLFADSFFMPLMFFISGLFVFSSLGRKGAIAFLRDRLWRLGIPFLISIFILVPIAYYPSFLLYHLPGTTDFNFFYFWGRTLTVGPWPSGPAWFLWVLVAFNILAAIAWFIARPSLEALGRWIAMAGTRPAPVFAIVLAIILFAYVPFVLAFGRQQWFAVGPISVQSSRLGLYAACFLLGVTVGVAPLREGVLSERGAIARSSLAWLCLAGLAFVALATLRYDEPATLNFIGFEIRLDMSQEAILKAVAFGLFCTSMSFATIAIALRFANRSWAAWRFLDAMNPVAYGIFLMHFTFIIWLQYAVYSIQIPAIVKFTFVFAGALSGSWIMTRVLRSSPVIARMI